MAVSSKPETCVGARLAQATKSLGFRV